MKDRIKVKTWISLSLYRTLHAIGFHMTISNKYLDRIAAQKDEDKTLIPVTLHLPPAFVNIVSKMPSGDFNAEVLARQLAESVLDEQEEN